MVEQAKEMIRARIRRNGRRIELGYFKTKAEVAAAQEVAHAILDEWDEVKNPTPKLPSPVVLTEAINQGAYDTAIEAIATTALRRHQLVERYTRGDRHWAGTPAMKDAKWQALREKTTR